MVISPDRAVYVGLAALVVLAIWFVRVTGFSASEPDKQSRRRAADPRSAELLRMRKTVLRQIEQQSLVGWGRRRSDLSNEGLDRLKAIVREIDAELQDGSTPPARNG